LFTKIKFFFNVKKINFFLNLKKLYLYIPHQWNFTLLTDNFKKILVLFLYSDMYFFKISFKNNFNFISCSKNPKVLLLYSLKSIYADIHHLNCISKILFSFSKPLFRRLKFKGKGYYVFKNKRNTITPQFGYAHRIYIYSFFLSIKFLRKTSVLIFGLQLENILYNSFNFFYKRKINIFTGRGVRFSRQVIYRKKGKISTYR